MGEFVSDPERNQFRRKPEPVAAWIDAPREVFEANESDPPAVDDEFARVGGPDSHHEADIGRTVDLEKIGRLSDGPLDDLGDGYGLEQGLEIAAVGSEGGPDDFIDMRTIEIQHIVAPISAEYRPVGLEIPLVGGFPGW